MIDKIFEMLLKEARSRPGDDFFYKLSMVILELEDKIVDFMEEVTSHDWDDFPSEEELAKANSPICDAWMKKKRQERRNGPL